MYKVILFDLDGTLTESGEGITKSVQYALERIGKPEPDLEKLKVFIDRKSTRLNSSHIEESRMPSSA